MLAAPTRDWSVFQQIFAEHWEAFQPTHPRYQTPYDDGLVAKMLAGGHPDQIGSIEYRCLHGGQGKHLVAMRCQSSLGLRCAKVAVDPWVSQGRKALQAGGISRHSILTVPARCRTTCSQHAAVVLRALRRCGAPCLDDFSSTVRGKTLPGGSLTVLHTPGRHGQSHPPLHLLAPSGGDATLGERWEPRQSLPSALLRRTWPWHLLTRLRQTLQTKVIEPLVAACLRQYPDGLVTNVPQGQGPAQSQRVARSVAKEVVSPPISVRRIDRDDGGRVTSHDRSHRTDRMADDTVPVKTFLGRMVPQVMPQGCKRLRSDGVQATKTFAKVKRMLQTALAKVAEVVQGAVKIIARLTSRQRDEPSTGRAPFRCPHGQRERELWCIWHPTYGVIYDEGEGIKRGTYAATAQRAGP